jgi:hypothetical protein
MSIFQHRFFLAAIIAALAFVLAALGQAAGQGFTPWQNDFTPASGAGRAPEGDPAGLGPWATRVLLATSDDGLNFTRTGQVVADQAGVPAALVDHDGYVRVYYQAWLNNADTQAGDFPAFAIRNHAGEWFHHKIVMDSWTERAVDAHVVLLPDGRYRLYFMEDIGGGRLRICSGTGTDGKYFTRDQGFRLIPENDAVFDPMVLKTGDEYLLVAGPDGSYHAYSADGLDFTSQGPFVVEGRQFMAWSGVAAIDGGYRLYGNFQGEGALTSVYSPDGRSWTAEPGWRLGDAPEFASEGSPPMPDNGACALPDGTFIMAYLVRIPD